MRIYTPDRHRFFDGLVAMLSSLTGVYAMVGIHRFGFERAGYNPDFNVTLKGARRASGIALRLYPFQMMTALTQDRWPDRLELEELPLPESPDPTPETAVQSSDSVTVFGLAGVQANVVTAAYIQYFEFHKDAIASHFGRVDAWPEPWRFGRVVRNACAHGGRIRIDNPSERSVTWNGLTYSSSDNGRLIMFTDITPVEVILLLEDLDAAL